MPRFWWMTFPNAPKCCSSYDPVVGYPSRTLWITLQVIHGYTLVTLQRRGIYRNVLKTVMKCRKLECGSVAKDMNRPESTDFQRMNHLRVSGNPSASALSSKLLPSKSPSSALAQRAVGNQTWLVGNPPINGSCLMRKSSINGGFWWTTTGTSSMNLWN
jgi:hypothetical protein